MLAEPSAGPTGLARLSPRPSIWNVEETTQKRLALSAGELVPLDFDDLVALHGKLREPIAFLLRIWGGRVDGHQSS
jgi:hypothetical protein